MTEKYYDIYFEPSELEVDGDGHLGNGRTMQHLFAGEGGTVFPHETELRFDNVFEHDIGACKHLIERMRMDVEET